MISEWQPPDLRRVGFWPFGLSVALPLALGLRRPPLRTSEVLCGLAFTMLALQSVRNIQLYVTVAVPLIGAALAQEQPAFRRTVDEWRNPWRIAALWILVVALSGTVWVARFRQASSWPVQLGSEPASAAFPVAGAAYMRDHDLQGALFNQFEWGGYVIYADWPQQRVFIDGRPDMYGPSLFSDYVKVVTLQPNWRQTLDEYNVQLILVDKDGALAAEIARDVGWHELYVGPVERLFQRAS